MTSSFLPRTLGRGCQVFSLDGLQSVWMAIRRSFFLTNGTVRHNPSYTHLSFLNSFRMPPDRIQFLGRTYKILLDSSSSIPPSFLPIPAHIVRPPSPGAFFNRVICLCSCRGGATLHERSLFMPLFRPLTLLNCLSNFSSAGMPGLLGMLKSKFP